MNSNNFDIFLRLDFLRNGKDIVNILKYFNIIKVIKLKHPELSILKIQDV